MNRTHFIVAGVVVLIALFLLIGCGKKGAPEPSMTAGHAVIGASDAIYRMAWKLSAAFQTGSPAAFVDIVRNDDRSLVDSLLNERTEEIFLDRALAKVESIAFVQAKLKLYVYPVAYYPVFLLARMENPVSVIDSSHLRGALTGTIHNWRDLGGGDVPLTVYAPLVGDGAFQSVSSYFGRLDSVNARVCSTAEQMIELSRADEGALLIYALPVDTLPTFKRLSFEHEGFEIPANVQTIIEEPVYPFRLNITYVTTHNKSDVAAGYLTFAVSNTGQREVMRMGYRPAAVPVRIVRVRQ
jgi:hypothetical protein